MSDLWQQLNLEMSSVVENVRRSLVQITNGWRGAGAGIVWHPDGLILTNAHVVGRRSLRVTLPDEQTLPARLLAHSADLDLAALAVDATGLPTIELGKSKRLQPGQWVLALGHPWGVTGAVTAGVVIDVGQPLEGWFSERELIQVDLPVLGQENAKRRQLLIGLKVVIHCFDDDARLSIPRKGPDENRRLFAGQLIVAVPFLLDQLLPHFSRAETSVQTCRLEGGVGLTLPIGDGFDIFQ